MTAKAKPEFHKYGIHIGRFGRDCVDFFTQAHKGRLCYVGDKNTLEAAENYLPKNAFTYRFTTPPRANDIAVEQLREHTAKADAIIAVGSGTLNDLCKYASFLDGKPYSVLATAASMNGYVSANASLTMDGYKKTLPAHAPKQVVCDLNLLASAPRSLTAAGVGDVLCRSTIQTDWLFSHLLLNTPYDGRYYEWLAPLEQQLLAELTEKEADWSREALMRTLISALLTSGLSMRHYGSSSPASQGEHLIAHCIAMLNPTLEPHYHGQEIAVTTLTMAERQQQWLQHNTAPTLEYHPGWEEFPPHLQMEAQAQYYRKFKNKLALDEASQRLQQLWPEIVEKLTPHVVPVASLRKALKHAGCPLTAKALHWPPEEYARACRLAPYTRDRFTFLDLPSI